MGVSIHIYAIHVQPITERFNIYPRRGTEDCNIFYVSTTTYFRLGGTGRQANADECWLPADALSFIYRLNDNRTTHSVSGHRATSNTPALVRSLKSSCRLPRGRFYKTPRITQYYRASLAITQRPVTTDSNHATLPPHPWQTIDDGNDFHTQRIECQQLEWTSNRYACILL